MFLNNGVQVQTIKHSRETTPKCFPDGQNPDRSQEIPEAISASCLAHHPFHHTLLISDLAAAWSIIQGRRRPISPPPWLLRPAGTPSGAARWRPWLTCPQVCLFGPRTCIRLVVPAKPSLIGNTPVSRVVRVT